MTSPNEREMLAWIAQASIRELLHKVRFEPTGSAWFDNETVAGELMGRLAELRSAFPDAYVAASKSLGW